MLGKLKDLGNLTNMVRQAEEFKGALKNLQSELEDMVIIVESDGSVVKVTCNGQGKIRDLEINNDKAGSMGIGELQSIILETVTKAQQRSVYIAEERRDRLFSLYKIDKNVMAGL